jgi:hypothetical protein
MNVRPYGWPSYWHSTLNIVNDNLQQEMDSHYERLNEKIGLL